MPPTDSEYRSNRASATTAHDYRLWAAQNDPFVRAGSNFMADKFGASEGVGNLISMLLQQFMGMQNSGVNLADTVQNSLRVYGAPSSQTQFGYSGSISGSNVVALDVSKQLTDSIQDAFYRANGVARESTAGLSQNEISGVVGQLMGAGAQYRFGNMVNQEVLTQGRIEEIRAQARGQGGDAIRAARDLEVGQLHTSLDETKAGKFNEYVQQAVRVVGLVKSIVGNQEIAQLESKIQETLGMSLPEFGLDNARSFFSKARSAGITYFGGDSMTAMNMMMSQAQMGGAQAAQMLGMDPRMGGALQGVMASAEAANPFMPFIGHISQTRASGFLAGQGFDTRRYSTDEIAASRSYDTARYATEEKEALALATYLQRAGANIDGDDRSEIQAAMDAIAGAGTREEVAIARGNAARVFNRVSGGMSVGGFIGNNANQARLLASLRGEGLDMFGGVLSGVANSRQTETLRRAYATDSALMRRTELSSSELSQVGMGIANLSQGQLEDLLVAQGIGGEEIDKFLAGDDIQFLLASAGVDSEAMRAILPNLGREDILDIFAQRNQYDETQDFVAEGARQEEARKQLRQTLAADIAGPAKSRGDAVTEFIRGFSGDTMIRGGAIVGMAAIRNPELVRNLALQKSGEFELTEANYKTLMASEDGRAYLKSHGIDDYETFKSYLGEDATRHQELLTSVSKSGAFTVVDKDGKKYFSYVDTKDQKTIRKELTGAAYAEAMSGLQGGLGADATDEERAAWKEKWEGKTKQGEDESDEEYHTRMSRLAKATFGRYKRERGGLGGMAREIARNDKYANKLMMIGDSLTEEQRSDMLAAVQAEGTRLEGEYFDKKDDLTEEEKKEYDKKMERLQGMSEYLSGSLKSSTVNRMVVTNMEVTGEMSSKPTSK